MKRMKKLCARGCGHLVSAGDRHGQYSCPPKAGRGSAKRRAKKRRIEREMALALENHDRRGVPVAGVGGSKAGKHRTKKALAKKSA